MGRHALVVLVVLSMLASARLHAADEPAPAEAGESKSASKKKWKLLVLDVKSSELDKSQAEILSATLADRAARFPSLQVITAADIRDMVELEANKQEAGCDEGNASCLAEVAGAMGADFVLSTRAGKLDAVFVVSLQLFDARVSSAEGRASVEGWALAELPAKLGPPLDEMLEKVLGEKPVERAEFKAPPAKPVVDDGVRTWMKIGGASGAVAGALLFGVGAAPALMYGQKKDELGERTANFDGSKEQLAAAGRIRADALDLKNLYNDAGRWGVAVGVALIVAGGGAAVASFLLPAPASEAGGEGAGP